MTATIARAARGAARVLTRSSAVARYGLGGIARRDGLYSQYSVNCVRFLTTPTSTTPPPSSPSSPPPKQGGPTPSQDDANPITPSSAITTARGADLVLSPPALVVTREYEWGNIILGFEQANKYTIRAAPGGEVVGYIAEQNSITRAVARNLLRTRRSFRATVLDRHGDTVFVMRRPAYLVSSSIYVEHPDGTPIGEVQMRWHVYRRRYDCYVNKAQFARVDSGFLAVDFDMVDEHGAKLASVNKDFTGFAREIFTDARQYVLRLDPSLGVDAMGIVNDQATLADAVHTEQKLTADQRAVLLATAISIDFDYFSIHSRGPLGPGMFMPMPIPGGGAADAGAMAGADAMMGDPDDDGLGPVDGEEAINAGGGSGEFDGGASEFDEMPTSDFNAPNDESSEWGTFEEPDYGFQEEPVNEEWSDSSGADEEGGASIFGILSDIFGDGE